MAQKSAMVRHSPFVGAYWGAREESREECAERTFRLLECLRVTHLVHGWKIRGRSRTDSNKPFDLTLERIVKELRTNNRDDNHEPIVDLGFSFGAWSDNFPSGSGSFGLTCGAFAIGITNVALLTFPPTEKVDGTHLHSALVALVDAFSPDTAVATTIYHLRAGRAPVDAANYFSYRKGGIIEGGEVR